MLLFGALGAQAQPGCGELWFDSGGPSGNYSSNENYVTTFCPDQEGDIVSLYFTYVDIESSPFGSGNQGCWDYLRIYDGPTANSPLIGIFCGEGDGDGDFPPNEENQLAAGDVISSTSGCLTVQFVSDGSVQESGWEVSVLCGSEPTCTSPEMIVETNRNCDDLTYDVDVTVDVPADPETAPLLIVTASVDGIQIDGGTVPNLVGQSINLGPFAMDQMVTITTNVLGLTCPTLNSAFESSVGCPIILDCVEAFPQSYCYGDNDQTVFAYSNDSDQPITLLFTGGKMESCCDDVIIYDGPDANSPILYSGNNSGLSLQGISVTSTGGALFMAFDTDGSVSCQSGSTSAAELTWITGCVGGEFPGCTDPTALNYMPEFTVDDGSCVYPIPGQVCISALEVTELPYEHSGNTGEYFNDYVAADLPPAAANVIGEGSFSGSYLTGADVVYAYTPTENQVINASATGVGTWTGFWVFTGCPFDLTLGYHTSSSSGSRQINNLTVLEGVTYYFVISTYTSPETTPYTIHIEASDSGCEGTPIAGTIPTDLNICPGWDLELSSEGASEIGAGIVAYWESSPAGENDWTQVANSGVNDFVLVDGILEDTDFRFVVSCLMSGESDTSNVLQATINTNYLECYCIPTGAANNADEIVNFSLSNINNSSASGDGVNGYTDYTTTVPPAELIPGDSYVASLTSGIGGGSHGAAIWIDYNDNGAFEESEKVTFLPSSISGSATVDFPEFEVLDVPGIHRLRVQYTYLQSGADLAPCNVSTIFSETEDYLVQVINLVACEGTPSAGTPSSDSFSVCLSTQFTVAVQGSSDPAEGLIKNWQSSPAGENDWSDIPGATMAQYTLVSGIEAATDFRYVVTCTYSEETVVSDVISVELNAPNECYCTPTYEWDVEAITNVSFGYINNTTSASSSVFYEDFTSMSTPVFPGVSVPISLQGYTGGSFTNYFTVF
ncbi:MAG TPA: CUB domain-containing protein, partial [Cryomorphaceae bacterium]|nr:CUB domain-containing protein [Cryomorphaceae bacterium]